MNNAANARRLIEVLRTAADGQWSVKTRLVAAWRTVDAVTEQHPQYGRMAAGVARRLYGERPCARVGLETKPFRVVKTCKHTLAGMGRIKGGHRRI